MLAEPGIEGGAAVPGDAAESMLRRAGGEAVDVVDDEQAVLEVLCQHVERGLALVDALAQRGVDLAQGLVAEGCRGVDDDGLDLVEPEGHPDEEGAVAESTYATLRGRFFALPDRRRRAPRQP